MFNAEINAMSASQIGVKYWIIWCREAGDLPAECRTKLELLPGNKDKVAPHRLVFRWRKLTTCSGGETWQKLVCRGKDCVSGFRVRIAWMVSDRHSLLS